MLHDLITNLFAAMYLYFECMLLGVIVADAIAAKHEPHKDKDCIIILGCALFTAFLSSRGITKLEPVKILKEE